MIPEELVQVAQRDADGGGDRGGHLAAAAHAHRGQRFGGISHWPATPDSGKIDEAWDRRFLDSWCRNDRDALCGYDDVAVYTEAGQGGFEIRTFVAVSAAAAGAPGTVHFYEPIPIFAVGCTVADYRLG